MACLSFWLVDCSVCPTSTLSAIRHQRYTVSAWNAGQGLLDIAEILCNAEELTVEAQSPQDQWIFRI